jgi:hypothetical protein
MKHGRVGEHIKPIRTLGPAEQGTALTVLHGELNQSFEGYFILPLSCALETIRKTIPATK